MPNDFSNLASVWVVIGLPCLYSPQGLSSRLINFITKSLEWILSIVISANIFFISVKSSVVRFSESASSLPLLKFLNAFSTLINHLVSIIEAIANNGNQLSLALSLSLSKALNL